MRSASGESTPRSTQPLCVTLREGERGGSKVSGSRAGQTQKKARDSGALGENLTDFDRGGAMTHLQRGRSLPGTGPNCIAMEFITSVICLPVIPVPSSPESRAMCGGEQPMPGKWGGMGEIGEHWCEDRDARRTSLDGRPGAESSIPSNNSDAIDSPTGKSGRGRCETRAAAKLAHVRFFSPPRNTVLAGSSRKLKAGEWDVPARGSACDTNWPS